MESAKIFDICSLGSASNDLTVLLSRLPSEGETLQAIETYHANGGKGANTAVAAGRLNAKVCFVGQLGQDSGSESIIKEMSEAGVNLHAVRRIAEAKTGLALIFLNEKRENSIVIIGGANTFYKSLDVIPEEYQKAIRESSILMLQREITQEINVLAAIYARKNRTLVVLDYGGRDEQISEDLLGYLDFVSPNETELSRLMNSNEHEALNPEAIKSTLLTKYKDLRVLLKLGSKGSHYISNTLEIRVPASPELNEQILKDFQIVDTTGAGDGFTAAFFVKFKETILKDKTSFSLEEEKNSKTALTKCLIFAGASAFVCITTMGAMVSQPKRTVVDDFINKYLKSHFE